MCLIMKIGFMVFFNEKCEIYLLLLTSSKILIVAEVIIGQRSVPMPHSMYM